MTDVASNYLNKPIVVVGAPRSGTSFLGKLLSKHPALAYSKEPRLTWRYGNDHKSDMLRPEDARPEVCQHIRRVFADSVQSAGRQRLVEKTPSSSLRMGFVEKVLPECLFLHIIRDGTESALSIRQFWNHRSKGIKREKLVQRLKEINLRRAPYYFMEFVRRAMPQQLSGATRRPAWGPRIPGLDEMIKELDVLEIASLQWRMCVESACNYGRQLPKDRYLECRLEDMSLELVETVLEFCDLSMTPEVRAGFDAEYDPGLTTSRASAADPADLEMIQKWIGPTKIWLEQDNFQQVAIS